MQLKLCLRDFGYTQESFEKDNLHINQDTPGTPFLVIELSSLIMFLTRITPIGIRAPFRHSMIRTLSTTRSLFNDQLTKPKTPPSYIDIESPEYQNHPIIKRLPRSMKKYGKRFINAPVSHLTAFVILHELTALVPFLGLWYAFHKVGFLPTDIPSWVLVKGSSVIESIVSVDFSVPMILNTNIWKVG